MDNQPSPADGPRTCPSCGSPVDPGHKFCPICGTKMEELPTCRKCGARFPAPARFCEVCGTPVSPKEKPRVVVTSTPEPEQVPPESPPVKKSAPAPSSPAPEVPETVTGKKPSQQPEPSPSPPKAPVNKVRIIGGVVVLLVVLAAVYFVGLPMMRGDGPGFVASPPPVTPAETQTQAMVVVQTPEPTPIPTTTANPLVPLPTQQPPKNQEVFFQVQKNQVNTGITVLFAGGPGINSISSAEVWVTHPDGTVVTGTIQPSKGITEITLIGSKETDRVEVIVKMYTGQSYRVIDELQTYKAR